MKSCIQTCQDQLAPGVCLAAAPKAVVRMMTNKGEYADRPGFLFTGSGGWLLQQDLVSVVGVMFLLIPWLEKWSVANRRSGSNSIACPP